jgi:release factor glutamine methyltransferase
MTSPTARHNAAELNLLLEDAVARLSAASVDSPRLDAELLLALAAGVTREGLFAKLIVSGDALRDHYAALVDLRRSRMPVAYILGRREFYSLQFQVSLEVLIPRPETETLVTAALEVLESDPTADVLDLGTGCGAIALAIAANARRAHVIATDISATALEVAACNAARFGVGSRVDFRRADCWSTLDSDEPLRRYDLIVSNPPYIRETEIDSLAPEVRNFEPRLALAGGPDGLDFYRRIATGAGRHLMPRGIVIVEVGAGQAGDVAALFGANGFAVMALIDDLAGIQRVVKLRLA